MYIINRGFLPCNFLDLLCDDKYLNRFISSCLTFPSQSMILYYTLHRYLVQFVSYHVISFKSENKFSLSRLKVLDISQMDFFFIKMKLVTW